MSTALDDQTETQPSTAAKFVRLARVLAVVACLISLGVLWASERAAVPRDLQLVTEAFARPGETLAVRALLLERLTAPEGPALVTAEVELRLADAEGRIVAEAKLRPEPLTQSMEGEISVPATLRGKASLEALVVGLEGEPARCVRTIEISEAAPTLKPRPREASPLQRFSAGSVVAGSSKVRAPRPFLPRISGGVCIPEAPCSLLVWVGEPRSAVRIEEPLGVSVQAAPAPELETAGLVEFELVVHGLEAQLVLAAYRAGERVAERKLRLPVGLGEVGVSLPAPLLEPDAAPQLSFALPPGRTASIVDVFVRDRYRASQSFAQPEPDTLIELPAHWFPAGEVSRVQARVDRYTGEGAGTRLVYRRGIGETPLLALHNIARFAEALAGAESRQLSAVLPALAAEDVQRTAAYLLAPGEQLRVQIPDAWSDREAQVARLSTRKTLSRFAVGGVLLFAGLLVAVTLMQRGFSADDEARAILERAVEANEGSVPATHDGRLGVVLVVLAVVLAFLAGALLIVSKSLWF